MWYSLFFLDKFILEKENEYKWVIESHLWIHSIFWKDKKNVMAIAR